MAQKQIFVKEKEVNATKRVYAWRWDRNGCR